MEPSLVIANRPVQSIFQSIELLVSLKLVCLQVSCGEGGGGFANLSARLSISCCVMHRVCVRVAGGLPARCCVIAASHIPGCALSVPAPATAAPAMIAIPIEVKVAFIFIREGLHRCGNIPRRPHGRFRFS